VFVHHSGFIGGNRTREGALQMAVTTMQLMENCIQESTTQSYPTENLNDNRN